MQPHNIQLEPKGYIVYIINKSNGENPYFVYTHSILVKLSPEVSPNSYLGGRVLVLTHSVNFLASTRFTFSTVLLSHVLQSMNKLHFLESIELKLPIIRVDALLGG